MSTVLRSTSTSGGAIKEPMGHGRRLAITSFSSAFPQISWGQYRLLEQHSTTPVQPVYAFTAAEAFRIETRIGSRGLSVIGLQFKEHFLSVVEGSVPKGEINAWNLLYTAGDKSLVNALGGEERAVVPFLAYVHQLMEMGEKGPCLLDWRSNFAYLRSPIDRRLWAVHWSVNSDDKWVVGAVYVPHPHLDWRSDSRLFGG